EKEYYFSNYFEFNANEVPFGTVVKKRFAHLHLTNHYEVYDDKGLYEARGASRFFSLGALFSWATKIDVVDNARKTIGMIDGKLGTLQKARFNIYEYDNAWQLKGIAYMDQEKRSFSIHDPNNDKHILASLKRILLPNERDHWECHIFEANAIDLRIVKIFAAFAVDHQEYFKSDN
ncbi:MAG: hypothetical protein JSS12_06485, partial [Verrucomicrobia bacterium]|nr:hypothetical protein [Verrucomicrobiota bacterium]